VLVACGAFTNGPRRLLPAKPAAAAESTAPALQLDLTNRTTQTVHFILSDSDAARLDGMPSLIAKFADWWAYVLPPIQYPDGKVVLKLGGARDPSGASATADSAAPRSAMTASSGSGHTPPGSRPLLSAEALIAWYRSGGELERTAEMTEILHGLVPGVCPLEIRSDACANCTTPTGLPYIGPVRDGLYVATGGNGLAAKAALASGGWDEEETHPLLAAARFQPRLKP